MPTGLFAFVGESDRLMGRDDAEIIITPHPGEMARLTGLTVEAAGQSRRGRPDVCHDAPCARDLERAPHGRGDAGRESVHQPDRQPALATGGTGDVLTGMVAAWFAQLLDPADAAQLAVYLHGLAGDLAAADEGEVAMVAGDLVDRLGDAVLELTSTRQRKTAGSPNE